MKHILIIAIFSLFLPACQSKKQHVHRAEIPPHGLNKMNPLWWFGNADTKDAPDWYRPGKKFRTFYWRCRNPLHNFFFYVIGVADQDFVRYGKEPAHVFSPEGGWNWAVIHCGIWRLPFISYESKHIRFYLLWRERGNLGAKLNFR